MQLSSRIIKSEDVEHDSSLSYVETEVDLSVLSFPIEDEIYGEFYETNEVIEDSEEKPYEKIDIEKIKEDIKKQLYKEIEYEKNQIINKANEEAINLKQEAKDNGYKDGIRKGFVEGYDKGKEEAEKDCQGIKENAINMVKQAGEHVEEYYEENQKRIIRLAADMAESIVHDTIDTSSQNVLMLVKPVLQQYRKKEQIIITAHPESSDFLKTNLNKLLENNEDTKFVILEDSSIEKNGCTIENDNQIIDLQIRKQLERIIDEINNLE